MCVCRGSQRHSGVDLIHTVWGSGVFSCALGLKRHSLVNEGCIAVVVDVTGRGN